MTIAYETHGTEEVRVALENIYATPFSVYCVGYGRFSVCRNISAADKVIYADCPVALYNAAVAEMSGGGYFIS